MKYESIIRAVCGDVWAIMPDKAEAIAQFLEIKANGGEIDFEARQPRQARGVSGGIAVIPIVGTITQRADMMTETSGGTSTERIGAAFDAAMASPDVGAIVLDVDSPGGSVYGVSELADKIHSARGVKPIVAVANSLAASAGYWLASAAKELVVTPGGEVGSIGVLAMHTDVSEAEKSLGVKRTIIKAGPYKTEGNPHEPLGEDAQAFIQKRVDEYYAMFVKAVGRFRGIAARDVEDKFGGGRVFGAQEAVSRGMATSVETFQQVIARLASRQASTAKRRLSV